MYGGDYYAGIEYGGTKGSSIGSFITSIKERIILLTQNIARIVVGTKATTVIMTTRETETVTLNSRNRNPIITRNKPNKTTL